MQCLQRNDQRKLMVLTVVHHSAKVQAMITMERKQPLASLNFQIITNYEEHGPPSKQMCKDKFEIKRTTVFC